MVLAQDDVKLFNLLSDGVIVFDDQARLRFMNKSARDILGFEMVEVPLSPWPEASGVFFPDKKTVFPKAQLPFVLALCGESVSNVELYVGNNSLPDGGIQLSMSGQPFESDDLFGGAIVVFRSREHRAQNGHDSSQSNKSNPSSELSNANEAASLEHLDKPVPTSANADFSAFERLKTVNEQLTAKGKKYVRYAAIVQVTDYAIFTVSLEGRITSWNRGAIKQFMYSADEMIGQDISIIFTPELRTFIPEWLMSIRRNESIRFSDFAFVRKEGATLPISMVGFPIKNESGEISEAAFIGRDATIEKRQERQRAIEINKHKDALASANRELTQLMMELTAARDQAQAASALKSEFVANVSHEIRTPMNGVIGMCNALLKTTLTNKQRDCAQSIKDAGDALLTVINDILDFSKVEAGKLNIEIVDFDPISLAEGVCGLLVTQSRAKKLELVLFVDPKLPQTLRGDPDRLRQILSNLISNAIKFSSQGQVIVRVECRSVQQEVFDVLFSVTDQGIGISEEEERRLFKPFVQADGSITRRFGGTGLGLSISKHLVTLMNGTIGVESKKGEGSRFWFAVPLEARTKETAISRAQNLGDARVLIVDDEKNSQEVLHRYLHSWGLRSETAVSAAQAMEMLQLAHREGDPYQIAILDLVMPERSGFDLARDIAENNDLNPTKLMLVTAYDTPDLDRHAAEIGFRACLRKPLIQAQLLNCLHTLIRGEEASDSNLPASSEEKEHTFAGKAVILIADDHPINQQVAQMYLEDQGLVSHIVSNGKEAVDAVGKNEYAMILMDCQMPEMDGFAATSVIRKAESLLGRKTPIIAMTANAMEGAREQCIAAGMDDYISKPLDPDLLKKMIEKWLSITFAPPQTEQEIVQLATALPEEKVLPVFDLSGLTNKFKPQAAAKLVEMFLSSTPATLEKIETAIEEENRQEVAQSAHYLKGAAATISATQMTELCQNLETSAKTNADWQNTRKAAEDLQKHFLALRDFLRESFKMEGS